MSWSDIGGMIMLMTIQDVDTNKYVFDISMYVEDIQIGQEHYFMSKCDLYDQFVILKR